MNNFSVDCDQVVRAYMTDHPFSNAKRLSGRLRTYLLSGGCPQARNVTQEGRLLSFDTDFSNTYVLGEYFTDIVIEFLDSV